MSAARHRRESTVSATDLLAIVQPWAGVAEPVHERIARLADARATSEVLWVGCGSGRSVLWWAGRYDSTVQGVDPDATAIAAADLAARRAGLSRLVTFQASSPENLPHESGVFDLTVVNALYLPRTDARVVLAQAARVTRPMRTVVALVPSWLGTPLARDAARIESLGLRPLVLVEWKDAMRAAGLVELTVDDATLDGRWIARRWVGLLARAWRVGRWRGLRAVLGRPVRALRLLVRTRVLGLSVIKGTRWPHG